MFNTNTKATRDLNEKCIKAAHLRLNGADFRRIGERFGVKQDRARSMVARGEKLMMTTTELEAAGAAALEAFGSFVSHADPLFNHREEGSLAHFNRYIG